MMTTLTAPTWKMLPTSSELTSAFEKLVREWKRESGYLSSSKQMALLPSYQRIIGFGPAALPLILNQLEREVDHWFWALEAITGDDPVSAEDRGSIRNMADAWLSWGRQNGLIGFEHES